MSITAPASPDAIKDTAFETVLRRHHITSGQRCLMVVDAAQLDDNEVLQALYATTEAPVWHWLFDDSALSLHADAGPVVVETHANSEFCSHAIHHWAGKGLVFIVSEQPADSLLAGLRQMLWVDLETFGPTILRAYDTRFLQLFHQCMPQQMAALAGPEVTWVWGVDVPEGVDWSVLHVGSESVPISTNQSLEFERLLSWAAGWPRYHHLIATNDSANAGTLAAYVAQQWRAGIGCPGGDVATLTQSWQAFLSASGKGINQADFEGRA